MEVASAKYMQTLYWDKQKSADPASNVLARPAGELLDPATAAQQLAHQQALATGQASPSPAAVAVASSPGRRSGDAVCFLKCYFGVSAPEDMPCHNPLLLQPFSLLTDFDRVLCVCCFATVT